MPEETSAFTHPKSARMPAGDHARLFALKILRRAAIFSGSLATFQRGLRHYLFRRSVTDFLDENNRNSFFLILSMPRSGSTLLCSALSTCEKVIALSEPFRAIETELAFQSKPGSTRCTHPLRVVPELLQNFSHLGINEVFLPYNLSDCKNHWLLSSVEKIKTICLVRDPRDVWSSVQQVTLAAPFLSTYVEDGIVPPQPEWLETTKEYFRWILDGQRFFVRYEDLVANPKQELHRISHYIGFQFNEECWSGDLPPAIGIGDQAARSGGRIFAESVGKFRGKLTALQINRINSYLERELNAFGYEI